ncbi:MAG TPA: BrnA antitoxin family protein [Gammaproteobacteria bacterium]|jgi:uncharacterized protein (DUF4415 family)|nr:BrnA antitoxin family protein [Gammaproteobacteria bacterium]
MKKKPLTNKSGHVRELKREDISAMRPAREVLPAKLLAALPKRKPGERGLQKSPKKVSVTVRYSPEVVNYFKSMGTGWQTRIDKVLMGYVKKQPKHAGHAKLLKHHKHSRNAV